MSVPGSHVPTIVVLDVVSPGSTLPAFLGVSVEASRVPEPHTSPTSGQCLSPHQLKGEIKVF